MVIFLLSAIAAYLACGPLERFWAGYLAEHPGRQVTVALVVVLALVLVLYGRVSGLLPYILLSPLVVGPEAPQAMLGALAGAMWRTFPRWRILAYAGSRSQVLVFVFAMAAALLAAVLWPHLTRLTAFETPYAKLQFATPPAEKQLELEIHRDLALYAGLATVTQTARIYQSECAYAAVKAGGFAKFRSNDRPESITRGPTYADFRNALAFRNLVAPFLVQVANAERRGYDVEGLRRRVGLVADKFLRVLAGHYTSPTTIGAAYHDAAAEVAVQRAALENAGMADKLGAPGPDPEGWDWCEPATEDMNEAAVQSLIDNTRYLYGAVAVMFAYAGNIEAVIKTYRRAEEKEPVENQINVTSSLGEALYGGERQFSELATYFERALKTTEDEGRKVDTFCEKIKSATKPVRDDVKKPDRDDVKICDKDKLPRRYDRARLNLKIRIAYLWAQEGTRWWTAQRYAQDNYDALQNGTIQLLRFPCLDEDEALYIKDTYAYVILAFQAHKYVTDRLEIDQQPVREARLILQELLSQLQSRMSKDERADQCFDQEQTKLWVRRINAHLKLAEAMLR
jgi:hypothetical protein